MVNEPRKQSTAWMETDYSKHTHFRWKIKWRLEHLVALGTMGETAPLTPSSLVSCYVTSYCIILRVVVLMRNKFVGVGVGVRVISQQCSKSKY